MGKSTREKLGTKFYIGSKLGKLTLREIVGQVAIGKKKVTYYNVWLCRCDCGRSLEMSVKNLGRKPESILLCDICRRGTCIVCGKYATNENLSLLTNTCSEKCKKEKLRRRVQGYLANLSEEEKEAARQKKLDRYYKLTDEQRTGNQQRKKERYANLSEEEKEAERKNFRAEWKRRMEKMTKQELAEYRRWQYEARQRWYKKLKSDPVRYAKHLAAENLRKRTRKKEKNLNKLLNIGEKLSILKDGNN
jgi:hypothetical protein